MKENKVILEDKIKEALPRLKGLSFGCEFKILDEYIPIKDLQGKLLICTNSPKDGIVPWEDVAYIYKDSYVERQQWYFEDKRVHTEHQHIYDLFTQYNYCNFESCQKDFIEIIGHPIKLNDVLQYLTFLGFPLNSYQYKEVLKLWFLDSVFLADQSDELKEFLNKL